MAVIVEARGLVKRFGRVYALRGLDLTVSEGRIMGLIGPNGAGKTTTMKILLGILRPNDGYVRVFNEDPWDNPRVKRAIGFLHEKPSFPDFLTAVDYLARIARMYGVERPEEAAWRYLKIVGLSSAANRKIKGFSAGMVQRLGLAQALMPNPRLVILDEPTSNLDPKARVELLDLIYRLHRDMGVTFLISSHVLPELSRICDEVALVFMGKVHLQGPMRVVEENLKNVVFRVMSDSPERVLKLVSELSYVVNAHIRGRDVIIEVEPGHKYDVYRDLADLAEREGVELSGIEKRTISLEEVFRRIGG